MTSAPPRPASWIWVVFATLGVPPTIGTAPPLMRMAPAASRLTVIVLSRLSPVAVNRPVAGSNLLETAISFVLSNIQGAQTRIAATACGVLRCGPGGRLGGGLEGALNLVESPWRFAGDFLEWYGATASDSRSAKSPRRLRKSLLRLRKSGLPSRARVEHVHVNARGDATLGTCKCQRIVRAMTSRLLETVAFRSPSRRTAVIVKRPTSWAYGWGLRSEGHPHQAGSGRLQHCRGYTRPGGRRSAADQGVMILSHSEVFPSQP